MIFNSFQFILVFLPITVIGYYLINRTNHFDIAKLFLFGMSLWFYAYANIAFLPIIIGSIVVNFVFGTLFCHITNLRARKWLLFGAITLNLGSLLYFKYLDFFFATINQYFQTSLLIRNILLPLGISFFTFQQIAYLVDSYRDNTLKYNFLDYALFVSFFPKIMQGPIAFHHELIPQFNDTSRKCVHYENLSKGLMAIAFGLAKKTLLADNLGAIVDWGYQNIAALGTTNALIVMSSYTLQIYFDFSGYCDIASGICLMLNIDLTENFNSPYRSKSIAEFWQRWHITLTRFFRTYVYFPLGGNRKGKIRTYINMFIIFFLSGLWHGAAFTFILWGILHGIGICLSKLCRNFMVKIPSAIRWFGTFLFVNIAWIYFRASTVADANMLLKQLFSFDWKPVSADMVVWALPTEFNLLQAIVLHYRPLSVYYTGAALLVSFVLITLYIGIGIKNTHERVSAFTPKIGTYVVTVLLLVWSILSFSEVGTFIYVNF